MIFYQKQIGDDLKNINEFKNYILKKFRFKIFKTVKFMSKSKFVHFFWALHLTMIFDDLVLVLTQQ